MTPARAAHFARIALGHVTRAYPHKADHVMTDEADAYRLLQMHPIFYGSFDWHSCVHGHWLLARIRRLYPDLPETAAIDAVFADGFTPDKVEAERAYLDRPAARTFERPYGWAWLLMLQSELVAGRSPHAATLRPLSDAFATLWREHLAVLTYPVRTGTHANSAFALVLAERYARVCGDGQMRSVMGDRAQAWFGSDRAAQVWEPSGEDFLSPTLVEALAMQRLLPAEIFKGWFAEFLPALAQGAPQALLSPVHVSDRSDGRIAHLDGLNLTRAWAMREIATTTGGTVRDVLETGSNVHLAASLDTVAGDYMGEHWLATFALLALTGLD